MRSIKFIGLTALLIAAVGFFLFKNKQNSACLKIPINAQDVEAVHELFDPNKPPEGKSFYKYSESEEVWNKEMFDVDADGKSEEILTANIAMNHTPHLLRIVKDGFVIFKAEGANLAAYKTDDRKGFLLREVTDWNNNRFKTTRYSFELGKFIPLWYVSNCYPTI